MAVDKKDKFKAAFGVVSDQTKADRRVEILQQLTDLDTALNQLPPTTPPKAVTTQRQLVENLRTALNQGTYDQMSNKEAYKKCGEVEASAKKIAKAIDGLRESETQLPKLQKLVAEQGTGALDKLVEKIGTRAKTAEDQGFLIAAIRARYNIDSMSGELTSGALPQFYKVLGMVPEGHARMNPRLTGIERTKKVGTSDFGSGTISINGGEGTPNRSNREKYNNSAGKKLDLPNFDSTTLHEIGHSVDDASGFMVARMRKDDFGGWDKSSREEVVGIIIDKLKPKWETKLGLKKLQVIAEAASLGNLKTMLGTMQGNLMKLQSFASLDDLARDDGVIEMDRLVKEFLDDLDADPTDTDLVDFTSAVKAIQATSLSKEQDPIKRMVVVETISLMRDQLMRAADAVKKQKAELQMLTDGSPDPNDATQLEKDPAILWAATIRDELWWKPSKVIEDTEVGGMIYQADGTKWWKYKTAARALMVRNYQFRSPVEWFAEVYAVFMLGKLAKTHPAYALIDKIDTSKKEDV